MNTHRVVLLEERVHALHLFRGEGLEDEETVVALIELGARLAGRVVGHWLRPADKTDIRARCMTRRQTSLSSNRVAPSYLAYCNHTIRLIVYRAIKLVAGGMQRGQITRTLVFGAISYFKIRDMATEEKAR